MTEIKNRYIFTLYNGYTIKKVRVLAVSHEEAERLIKEKYPVLNILNVYEIKHSESI